MEEKEIIEEWEKNGLGSCSGEGEKFHIIFAYPNPSGFLHTGHLREYVYCDVIARYQRMLGKDVFFPVGVHATGNAALAVSKRILEKKEAWINYLKENGLSDYEIEKMKDPLEAVEIFSREYMKDWKEIGILFDENAFAHTLMPGYQKFIQWQFLKLKEKGLLVQKPYYGTACVNCGPVAVDPSEMEISKGGNATIQEFTLLKFKFKDKFLVAATLRPETVFGQTNLWVNPDVEYVEVLVDNKERWVCSLECAEKLKYQMNDIKILGKINGKDLLYKTAVAPGVEREIPILPARFCDPKMGSGIVTSVPSDAPYDYVALKELQKKGDPVALGLEFIPIIEIPKYGNKSAVKVCEELKIETTDDPRIEEATKEVYAAGFHSGILLENCGAFAGKKVAEAKEEMKNWLISQNKAAIFYDLSEEVICRCGGKVVVKRIEDQWFIKYSAPELKEKTKEFIQKMEIYPEDFKKNLPSIIDWYQDRACTRKGRWLGTKFPFDETWIIEPIADSTVYPAYYIFAKLLSEKIVELEDLKPEFFDYVILSEGKPEKESWKKAKEFFERYYPVDLNVCGKEHRTVHVPVYIMNHVGIFPEKFWPKGVLTHGWVTGKGEKVSKSKGGAESIRFASKKYGADTLRFYYCHVASPFSDFEWNEETMLKYRYQLRRLEKIFEEMKGGNDKWIESRFYSALEKYYKSMESYELKNALDAIFFEFMKDLERGLDKNLKNDQVMKEWLKTLCPFIPFTCERLWKKLGGVGLISKQRLPELKKEKIDLKIEQLEDIVFGILEDLETIKKLTKIEKPKKIRIFVAEDWKRKAINKALEIKDLKVLMKELMSLDDMKAQGKKGAEFANWIVKHFDKIKKVLVSESEEKEYLEKNKEYLGKKTGAEVEIILSKESDSLRAGKSIPLKPAIEVV